LQPIHGSRPPRRPCRCPAAGSGDRCAPLARRCRCRDRGFPGRSSGLLAPGGLTLPACIGEACQLLIRLSPGRSLPKNHCAAVFYEVSLSLVRLVRFARIDRPACRICNVRLPYFVRKLRLFKVPPPRSLEMPDIAHPLPADGLVGELH